MGGGERGSNYLCSVEALSKKRKPRERKQRRSPTALSPHCQETGLGLDRGGEGSQGGGGKGEGDQNPAGVLRQHVMCQHGSEPNTLEPLQHGNIQ